MNQSGFEFFSDDEFSRFLEEVDKAFPTTSSSPVLSTTSSCTLIIPDPRYGLWITLSVLLTLLVSVPSVILITRRYYRSISVELSSEPSKSKYLHDFLTLPWNFACCMIISSFVLIFLLIFLSCF